MWADVLYDGPLINMAVLSYAVLSRVTEGNVDFDMAMKTIETLLQSLGLAQVRASALARTRFGEVLLKARAGNSGYGGRAQTTSLVKTLDAVISGLHLAQAFAHSPKLMLPPRQIEAIFGPDQLRDSELLGAFAAHLPDFVNASTPEALKNFMEHLILEDKLWEQLYSSTLWCFDEWVPIPDKLRIIMAFFDIFEVAFEALQESSIIDWRSLELYQLSQKLWNIERYIAPGKFIEKVVDFRSNIFHFQICHALLGQFSLQRSRGEPFKFHFLNGFEQLVYGLGLGTEAASTFKYGPSGNRTGLDVVNEADANLSIALRDGPLKHFCMLGRWIYGEMAFDVTVTSDDANKMWKMLDRMLNTPQLPLANASGETWVIFDHLRASVRDHVLAGGGSNTVEKLRPLLDAIEKVERMRSPADRRDGRMEGGDSQTHADGSMGQDAWLPDTMPIPGSSREAEGSRPAPQGFWDQRLFHPVPATTSSSGTDQITPRGWTRLGQPNLVVNEPSTSFPVPSSYPPHVPQFHSQTFASAPVPESFASPLVPKVDPRSFASSHVARTSVDPMVPWAQAPIQPVSTGIPGAPALPWPLLSNPYSSPSPSSGLIGVPPPGDAERHSPISITRDL